MAHPRAFRAAAGGKPRANSASRSSHRIGCFRRLIFAATLLAASVFAGASHAQSGPFAGMAGNWAGSGTVTLDDGSSERIRCKASYAVGAGGNGLNQTLTCASDSYRFNLASNVMAQGSALSGTWSENTRNIGGSLEGRASNGNFQIVASSPGFTADISLTTRGNKQSVLIKSESAFRAASISLSRY